MKSLIVDVHSLPVLPEIADSVIRMALDEEVSVSKIADLIEKDQALTARILSLANSSFYKRSRQVHTVREAVVAIGAEAVRTLALGLCVLNMFPSKKDSALDHNQFWRHCFGCAVYAEAMMNELAPQFRAKAFCAGLLHDIGKLVLDVVRPGEYASVVEKAGTAPGPSRNWRGTCSGPPMPRSVGTCLPTGSCPGSTRRPSGATMRPSRSSTKTSSGYRALCT